MDQNQQYNGNKDALEKFHELLLSWKEEQDAKNVRGRLSDMAAARKLGVTHSSYNAWLNKQWPPNFANAIQLEQHIPGVCQALGYPTPILRPLDKRLDRIIAAWIYIDERAKNEIYEHANEFWDKHNRRPSNAEPNGK